MENLEKEDFEAFAYADDLAVVGYNKSKLKECIRIVGNWADNNNMKINKKKSGIIFHLKRRHRIMELDKGDVLGYPIKAEYKYLGVYIDINMKLKF